MIVLAGIPEEFANWLRSDFDVQILSVDSAEEALAILGRKLPDCLIVASELPGGGEELVRRIRSDPRYGGARVLFALDPLHEAELGRLLVERYGVAELLAQPLDRQDLADHVARLTGLERAAPRPDPAMAAGIAALWERHKDAAAARVKVLEDAGVALLQGRLTPEFREAAHREAHKLAGSAGSFGFPEASRIAREIEQLLGSAGLEAPAETLRYSERVVRLHELLQRPPALLNNGSTPNQVPEILILDSDESFGRGVVQAADRRGLRAVHASRPGAARERMLGLRPKIAVVDLAMNRPTAGARSLLQVVVDSDPTLPVIVTSVDESLWDRLDAAQLGVRAFLQKPVTPDQLLDEVDRVLNSLEVGAARVLAVDDDPQVLALLEEVLGSAGFRVEALLDPLAVLPRLSEATPDLVILDYEMPHLNGVELCRVIRGDPRWQTLPVLILTARRDPDLVTRVFEVGADDFLLKPVIPAELISRIRSRLERARLHRNMAENDFLTGLPNRRKSIELIGQLRRLSERHEQPVSLAVLDLDHFKRINDEHGHLNGDRVLREVAAFLQRTFRGEDVVGRWGGEEFVLAMYGMTRAQAVKRLRSALDELKQVSVELAGGGCVQVTFSAGAAEFKVDGDDFESIYRAADQAMYQAKVAGRAGVRAANAGHENGAETESFDVLVVEDDEPLAGLLMHALRSRGLSVEWLKDGHEAFEWLRPGASTPGARVVLLDVDLPGMDGLALLRRLTQMGVTAHSRVVMLTARANEPEIVEALRSGAFDHIAKPFSVPVLLHRLERALER